MTLQPNQEGLDLARKRAHPHLRAAYQRIIDHGVDPYSAAWAMIQYGCCGMSVTAEQVKLDPVNTVTALRQFADAVFVTVHHIADDMERQVAKSKGVANGS